ncbi:MULTISPECIES: hypothetical protein [unclassified Streptomyces]|jgi:hypothetical protein|uniref:hypothetical protein n=1 Tax=unclassified Streptomyces TaxID=2593676 RepID=UPI0034547A58
MAIFRHLMPAKHRGNGKDTSRHDTTRHGHRRQTSGHGDSHRHDHGSGHGHRGY